MTSKQKYALLLLASLSVFAVEVEAQSRTYCTNVAGNYSCNTYDSTSSSQTSCTNIAGNLSCTTFGNSYDKVDVIRDYQAGQLVGTALGTAVVETIRAYQEHRRILRDKADQWNQFVQDTLAATELKCEADPAKEGTTFAGCRIVDFAFHQFLQRNRTSFVVDSHNVFLLAQSLDKTAPDDQTIWTETTFEVALKAISKGSLDKKPYIVEDGVKTAY